MEAGGPEQPRGQGAGRHQGAGHDGGGGRRQLLCGGEAVDMSGQGSCQEVSRSLRSIYHKNDDKNYPIRPEIHRKFSILHSTEIGKWKSFYSFSALMASLNSLSIFTLYFQEQNLTAGRGHG